MGPVEDPRSGSHDAPGVRHTLDESGRLFESQWRLLTEISRKERAVMKARAFVVVISCPYPTPDDRVADTIRHSLSEGLSPGMEVVAVRKAEESTPGPERSYVLGTARGPYDDIVLDIKHGRQVKTRDTVRKQARALVEDDPDFRAVVLRVVEIVQMDPRPIIVSDYRGPSGQ